ncbi:MULTISPECIES: GNAT family N-acetyltransferase [Bacillaceae]|uniref:GNAT family N-acetyltransferase n=1 Tax=Evansella alkalicola TaxID=745819 RepID=A0ABS6JYZ3_9BACI|nr:MULTISPECIES: GNAT family N-acetyltransferase [Bacillaceae]MBU9723457.1 GNAT family N-acetyltransferase [Bacillus alkalicola]
MVELQLAKIDDFNFFYEIKANKENMYWSGHENLPKYENLMNFFNETVKNQQMDLHRKIYIIMSNQLKCGYVYLDPIDKETASVSIAVIDKHSGKGLGRRALKRLLQIAKNSGYQSILAEIREDNVRSHKLFTSIGFKQTGDYHLSHIENLNKKLKMLQYRFYFED